MWPFSINTTTHKHKSGLTDEIKMAKEVLLLTNDVLKEIPSEQIKEDLSSANKTLSDYALSLKEMDKNEVNKQMSEQ